MFNYVIMLCYVLAISLNLVGATIGTIAGRRVKTRLSVSMRNFMLALLVVCFYDLAIYMKNYVIGPIDSASVIKLGDCLIAIVIAAWVNVADSYVDNSSYKFINHFVHLYCFAYAAFWFCCSLITMRSGMGRELHWILLVTDIVMACVLLLGSLTYIGEAVWSRQRSGKIYYLIAVTALLSWNYISYFVGEASIFWDDSRSNMEPLNLTVIFWLLIDVVNLFVVYNSIFKTTFAGTEKGEAEGEGSGRAGAREFELTEALDAAAERYGLTGREEEILRQVYVGKSNAEIAEALFISESTVKTHLYNIFRKLGVRNRIEAIHTLREE